MHRHSSNTASFFSVLIAALFLSLSLAEVAAAQGNTSLGTGALQSNTTGSFNTASGYNALQFNTTGTGNHRGGNAGLPPLLSPGFFRYFRARCSESLSRELSHP